MTMAVLSTLLLLATLFTAIADKDSDFYYSGFNNPNVNKKMYWKDAYNVLEDLDQFSALYITYHNCAHSLYPTNPGSGQDEYNEGYEHWYENSFPQFLANGAYSLYGILSNGNNGKRGGRMCHRGTYINSFFTNQGVETLAYPFGIVDYNGDIPTSECGGGEGGGEDHEEDRRELSGSRDGARESYGLGCCNGQFVYGQFNGGSCGGDIQLVSDYLETFNTNMKALDCVQIYDKSSYSNYTDDAYANDGYVSAYGGDDAYNDDAYNDDAYNAYNEDGKEEVNEEGGNKYNQYENSDPLDILAYSETCSVELYGSACPDPFGIKKSYERTLKRAIKSRHSTYGGHMKQAVQIASIVLLALSAVLFVAAFIVRKRFSKRSISDNKKDALIASTPLTKPRGLVHSASNKARTWKEKFQEFAEEEDTVVESLSKDDSYIHLNNDSPTEVDEPAPIPSSEKPVVAPLESASFLDPVEPVATPFPGEPSSPALATSEPTVTSIKKKRQKKRPWLNKISQTVFGNKGARVSTGSSMGI